MPTLCVNIVCFKCLLPHSTSCGFNLKRHFLFRLSVRVFLIVSRIRSSCNMLRAYNYIALFTNIPHKKVFENIDICMEGFHYFIYLFFPSKVNKYSIYFGLYSTTVNRSRYMLCLFLIHTTYRMSIILVSLLSWHYVHSKTLQKYM